MHISSKGRVTILAEIRERAGLMPNTKVDFEFDGTGVRLVPARARTLKGRGARLVSHLRGRCEIAMTTHEIIALMRGSKR